MEEAKGKKLDIGFKDRISLLPEPILHRILCSPSLSQKEAIRTCLLSKAWRYVGCTRPIIDLYFGKGDGLNSLAFLDRILQACLDRNLRLDEFSLWMSKDYVVVDTASLLNKWIPIIIQNMRVKRFDLSLNQRPQVFELPSSIVEAQDIQTLSLQSCIFKSSTFSLRVDLKLLRTLYLYDVFIPEEILNSILSNCPLIRKVSLLYCKGFTRIKPTNHLAYFNFRDLRVDYVGIEVGNDVQTLRTIKLGRCLLSVSRNKPLELAGLTRLSLENVRLSCKSFSCNLHCLEELKLKYCSGIKEFKLSSRSMKRLVIHNRSKPFRVMVDAPSIVSFHYEGFLPKSISFTTTSSDDHLWKSEIKLVTSSDLFSELYGLLKALSQSEISLALAREEVRRFWGQIFFGDEFDIGLSEEAKHELRVVVEHLTIKSSKENNIPPSPDYFLNMLFDEFRPSYMYMSKGLLNDSHNEHLKIADILFKHRETAHSSYIWKRVLEGVCLQVLYQNQSEWQPVEHTSFTELSKKAAESKELQLRFHLKWRD